LCIYLHAEGTLGGIYSHIIYISYKWVPVTTAWRVLGLRLGERQRQNYLLKASRDTDKKCFVQIEKHPYLLTVAA